MSQIAKVNVGHAIAWYKCGWGIFSANILNWVVMALIFLAIAFLLVIIPIVGMVAIYLLIPFFQAGLLSAAHRTKQGQTASISDLFSAFKMPEKRASFLTLGGLMLAAVFIAVIISVPFAGGSMMTSIEHMSDESMMQSADAMPGGGMSMMPAFSLGSFLFSILTGLVMAMLFFYAPALVLFKNMGAIEAVKNSFNGSLHNLLPLIVFLLIYGLLAIIAAIPLGLGMLILLPVVAGANYCSYKDIFA